ncbi:MAG: mobilization protein [Pleurocapsa sp. CRU_1_2]|nr:mobilization protein [Pleurocapsa sp. CRU_1_2]
MTTIHLVDGEKGGVGKSFVTRTMIQYALDRSLPFIAVETDRSNPDVNRVYPDVCSFAVFSESEKQASKADRIFELALENSVIVSLPSQVNRAVTTWISENQLLDLGDEHGVGFCKWFVTNGEFDSVRLFQSSLDYYKGQMNHILVKNMGLCDEWSPMENDELLQKQIQKYEVKVIDFPKLGYQERYLINQKQLRFDDARENRELSILGRQRVVNFLKAAYSAFDSTGTWAEELQQAANSVK